MTDNINPLSEVDLNEIIPKLTRFAKRKLQSIDGYGQKGGDLLLGKSAEDIVHQSFVKVCDGTRKWNKEKCPDFLSLMYGIIRSEVNHACTSRENKSTKYLETVPDYVQKKYTACKDASIVMKDIINGFFEFCKENYKGESGKYIEFTKLKIYSDLKRAEVAEEMQMTPEEVDNMRKKWKRRFLEYMAITNISIDSLSEVLGR